MFARPDRVSERLQLVRADRAFYVVGEEEHERRADCTGDDVAVRSRQRDGRFCQLIAAAARHKETKDVEND